MDQLTDVPLLVSDGFPHERVGLMLEGLGWEGGGREEVSQGPGLRGGGGQLREREREDKLTIALRDAYKQQ